MGQHAASWRWHWTSTSAVRAWDRVYRSWHNLDTPGAAVGPILRLEVRRAHRTVRLSDGTVVAIGDRFGMLHLHNETLGQLHRACPGPLAVGLEFRRRFLTSLQALAAMTGRDGRLGGVKAFAAVTIMHRGLVRLGFERDSHRLAWPGVTGAYQRALLASLHPMGARRVLRMTRGDAERLWISRDRLRTLYGAADLAAG